MKCFIIFAVIILVEATTYQESWTNFKLEHGKIYKTKIEENRRYAIFQENLLKINEHNKKYESGESSFKLGVNQFADLTSEEFQKRLNYHKRTRPTVNSEIVYFDVQDNVTDEIDWTAKGAVTKVKNQGQCGSCWSFSATGTVEGANFIKTGKLLSLSEQNLMDCAKDECYGCNGGWMDNALEYIQENGIMLEKDYPYEAVEKTCRVNNSEIAVKIKSFTEVTPKDEVQLKQAVALHGPVSVGIDASDYMQLYASGILDDKECSSDDIDMNHGVLITGYGTKDGKDYWIVKNSWGTKWGQKGYLWMSRNAHNQCGIANLANFPNM